MSLRVPNKGLCVTITRHDTLEGLGDVAQAGGNLVSMLREPWLPTPVPHKAEHHAMHTHVIAREGKARGLEVQSALMTQASLGYTLVPFWDSPLSPFY